MRNKILENLCSIFLITMLISCNNKQQGNIEDDQDEDIRIEGHEAKTAGDEAYAENAVGEYLNYISESGTASYPSPKMSLKLLASAILEQNKEANISSSPELQNLANLNIKEEYNISHTDFTTIMNAFKQSFESEPDEVETDMEGLEKTIDEINIEQIKDNPSAETGEFFVKAGELLNKMNDQGN